VEVVREYARRDIQKVADAYRLLGNGISSDVLEVLETPSERLVEFLVSNSLRIRRAAKLVWEYYITQIIRSEVCKYETT